MTDIKPSSDVVSSIRQEGSTVIVGVRGEIDLHNSSGLRSDLLEVLSKAAPQKLVLNLAEVPYMDSSAIAVLVESLQKMRKTGGKVYLTDLHPRVQGLLEIARLQTIFCVTATEADALAS